jgi:Protein of unknown function (DUF1761)
MHWTRFLLAVVVSGLAGSITDWLFMGVLFHNKYLETPEIWRNKPGESETSGIVASSLLGVVSSAAFIYLLYWTGALTVRHAELRMAGVVWMAGPVPVILSNVVWIKMHPLLGLSHSLGWLARFVVTGLIAVWLVQ